MPDFLSGFVTNPGFRQEFVLGVAGRDRQQISAALTERSATSRGMASTEKRLDRAPAELCHSMTRYS
jgi:hypothetical protein